MPREVFRELQTLDVPNFVCVLAVIPRVERDFFFGDLGYEGSREAGVWGRGKEEDC